MPCPWLPSYLGHFSIFNQQPVHSNIEPFRKMNWQLIWFPSHLSHFCIRGCVINLTQIVELLAKHGWGEE
jgi:hypothetical protein